MRGLGDSTQHELKVLGEQGVHTGGLARLAAGVANSSPLEVHPVAAGRLPVGPGAVPVACAEEITCLLRRASRTRRLCDTHADNPILQSRGLKIWRRQRYTGPVESALESAWTHTEHILHHESNQRPPPEPRHSQVHVRLRHFVGRVLI